MQEKNLSFNNYFNEWLYSKNGYYTKYKTIGKEGDFFTSVSTSSFFGGTIGKRVVNIIEDGFLEKDSTILEIGSHHGYLLADMIQFIYTLSPNLLDTLEFAIVEKHPHLQTQQKEYINKCFGDTIKLKHYNDINEVNLSSAFVIANEIYDAFPCDLVYTEDNVLKKAVVNNHSISFVKNDDIFLEYYCQQYKVTKGEIARGYEEFAFHLSKSIEKFEFITFDYGEKYPRNDFSCRVYKNHDVFPLFDKEIDLANLYQESDITYDVNFQHIIDSFEKNNIECTMYETQLQALVSFGIIELLEMLHQHVDEKSYLKEANKVKTLLNPTGMGDRFKMVSFRKN